MIEDEVTYMKLQQVKLENVATTHHINEGS
jgi:hypothetical protein